ncbi:MAG TPA: PAS domain S-box protein [Bacteroidota bacterium]|nr:PAS domain S-box protein [Bacteroidota bacterium]
MPVPLSKYGRVFDLMPEMIFIVDSTRKIIDHNKAAAELTRFSAEELQSMTIDRLVDDDHKSALLELLNKNHDPRILEARMVRVDGTVLDASIEIKRLYASDTTYEVVIATDVTEQRKMELDLLRFSNVIQHTVNPIQITDARGIMVYVNPAFERTSGYKKEELIGKNPNILSSGKHKKEFWKSVWEQILSGKVWVGEVVNKRKDGTLFHTELVISPIIDGEKKVVGFLGAHRDITEQKLLEQQLIRSQKMEAIGTLAAGIAHEVGNPLTSIASLVQVLQRTSQDQFAIEKLELIKNQINRIARIIRDLVDFSRPSNYIIKPTDVNQVLQDALNIVRYGKKVKHIEFQVELADHLPRLQVVPDQLVQVFINILMNAVDAIGEKSGKIQVKSRKVKSQVVVECSDSGKGINPEDRDKIFEPFYTTKEVGQGTGLGLWVSYGIVKNFGGEIIVESQPGHGSTFTVTLPILGE